MSGHVTEAAMWQRFRWRGRDVVVIQRWTDPFGRRMLRVADAADEDMAAEDVAAGMPEDDFLAEATRCRDRGEPMR